MNYQSMVNQEIINKNNEKGKIISFSTDKVVIAYPSGEKTYNPDIAFKNKFLAFVDPSLQEAYDHKLLDQMEKEHQKQVIAEKNLENAKKRYLEVNKRWPILAKKARIMQLLFGNDFAYPPYEEFLKKYKNSLHWEETIVGKMPGYYKRSRRSKS